MKSATLPSFWAEYRKLSNQTKERARKNYRLWTDNPFHPSLPKGGRKAPDFRRGDKRCRGFSRREAIPRL